MSGDVYAEPGIVNHIYCDPDNKENINIYFSAESLKVYDNPWVESTPPKTPEAQHTVVSENSGKRTHVRSDSVFLGVVCLLLLAGIIYLGIQLNNNKTIWRRERAQLTANNTQLSRERDDLWNKFCKPKPRKCENLGQSDSN